MNKIRAEAGKYSNYACPVCRSKCVLERNKKRPEIRCYASALAWRDCPDIYDEFTCPNADKKWHEQIEQLQREKTNTVSPSIKKLLDDDIDFILSSVLNGDI